MVKSSLTRMTNEDGVVRHVLYSCKLWCQYGFMYRAIFLWLRYQNSLPALQIDRSWLTNSIDDSLAVGINYVGSHEMTCGKWISLTVPSNTHRISKAAGSTVSIPSLQGEYPGVSCSFCYFHPTAAPPWSLVPVHRSQAEIRPFPS